MKSEHPMDQVNARRRAELAKIHVGAKQLGLGREAYESMLWTLCRVRSAADLDEHGRKQVLGLVRKIRAQLRAAGRSDLYADGIAQRMFHVDRYEWCNEDQLWRIVAALGYDARRHGR